RAVRPDRLLGPRPLRVSGPALRRRARRPAVRAADRGRGHRLDRALFGQRLDRPVAPVQGQLHADRRVGRAHLHRPALRRSHLAAGPRGPAEGSRGSGGDPRCDPLADVRARDPADPDAGAPHGVCARLRARPGRIRLGDLHRRQPADGLGDHAAAHHHQARAVRLPRRDGDRGRDAGRFVRAAARDQRPAGVDPSEAGPVSAAAGAGRRPATPATTEPPWVRRGLIAIALLFLTLFLFVPLAAVFVEALKKGLAVYWAAITDPDALSAIRLTLVAALVAVPLNLVFGVAAAWAIAKFDFRGKNVLLTLIDLPFSVSPVI